MDVSNKILILCTTFNFPDELAQTLQSILNVLNNRADAYAVILDNLSKDPKTQQILNTASHKQLEIIKNTVNHGKAIAVNNYIKKNISKINCPRIIISMDPDVVFSIDSFDKLVQAQDTIPNLGILAMRYTQNNHNPERNLWFPSKKIKVNDITFKITSPVFSNIPGPLFAINGYILL